MAFDPVGKQNINLWINKLRKFLEFGKKSTIEFKYIQLEVYLTLNLVSWTTIGANVKLNILIHHNWPHNSSLLRAKEIR